MDSVAEHSAHSLCESTGICVGVKFGDRRGWEFADLTVSYDASILTPGPNMIGDPS